LIDLHCHLLPGIDDGSPDMPTSIRMAKLALSDGISQIACTPHIFPGIYENTAKSIRNATERLRLALQDAGVPLQLHYASDTHMMPELISRLQQKTVPTFNGGRYFLLEPPHRVAPPHFEEFVFKVVASGYMPIITHPERLHWVDDHYPVFKRMAENGVWMQITSGSVTGRFGKKAQYWAERMLDDGIVHILATDAHNLGRRAPLMMEAVEVSGRWVGREEAKRLVEERPAAVLNNLPSDGITPIPALQRAYAGKDTKSIYARIRRKLHFLIKP